MQPSHSPSLAKTLAVGSQDLAALAGFFCTDSVERNALAIQYGHGVITTSALSILGALGLIKSTVKLALGLDQCRKSGFSLDSLRSVYGYAENEGAVAGNLVPCDEVEVKADSSGVSIKKTRRYLDSTTRPIVSLGNDIEEVFNTGVNPLRAGLQGKTLINLGNPVYERSLLRHPIMAGVSAFVCSGLTAWPIILGFAQWNWVLGLATIGLQVSLASMLAIPLWFSFQVDRPGRAITRSKFSLLASGRTDKSKSAQNMIFTQYAVNGGHGIYFHSSTSALESSNFKVFALIISTLCAVSYVCQYVVLKQASSRNAAVWIGCQAFLALVRVCYWILKQPNPERGEFCIFNNGDFEKLNILTLCRLLPSGTTQIPLPVWDYLRQTLVGTILDTACKDSTTEVDQIGQDELFFLDLDLYELYRHGGTSSNMFRSKMSHPWRLGLYLPTTGAIVPKLFVENPDMGNVYSHETKRSPKPWIMLPGLPRHDSADEISQRRVELGYDNAWFVQNKGFVGFVQSEEMERRPMPHNAGHIVIDLRKALRESIVMPQDRRQGNNDHRKIWICATKGVVLRDGDGWSESEPPYAVLFPAELQAGLASVGAYIDAGHDWKVMDANNDKLLLLSFTGLGSYFVNRIGGIRRWSWSRSPKRGSNHALETMA